MRLLRWSQSGGFSLTKAFTGDDAIPPYAILSHTWGGHNEDVTFEDMAQGTAKDKLGYEKIRLCGEQATQDGLEYFWIDSCCIDKANYAELSRAISSMFRWYRGATRCYVYLSDVSSPAHSNCGANPQLWEQDFRRSKWFTRGWTLQELLAPASVEFFSREWTRLGDKISLKVQIRESTSIPDSALQGALLSQFSDNERFLWMERRQTKLAEDKAYALLGIFDVSIPLNYGEGTKSAFKRLRQEMDKLKLCIQDLRLTDPRDDKMRIEETKGGLLKGSYRWVLDNVSFQQWHEDPESRLLWVKGDPGKGKTMLLCGIINELESMAAKTTTAGTTLLSYFFCQATDSRINNATAVLRGLLYLLVDQQPSLVSHFKKKYDHAGKALFEDANTWTVLSEIFTNILQDSSLNSTYLIVDALDECVTGMAKLLDFIVQKSPISSRVKWIVSGRNWPDIEEQLESAGHKVRLCLELNAESISMAVNNFIRHQVLQLAQRKRYDDATRNAVLRHLVSNSNNTFLWVALVCQNLEKISRWNVLAKLNAFPPGLDPLYERMMEQIRNSDDADLCKQILALAATVYRPITANELTSIVEILEDSSNDVDSLGEIIALCGSLLTMQDGIIYFVHQSAKDYLHIKAYKEIFPNGSEEAHYMIFSKSLQVMSRTLRRDLYGLCALGYPIEQVKQPRLDPLAPVRYSCTYWVDHLCDWNPKPDSNHGADMQDGGAIDSFIKKKYVYWLEALSLCGSMSEGVVSMAKLEALVQAKGYTTTLIEIVRDARRFIMYHKWAIEKYPLQAYASALLFSPACSLTRNCFKEEEPKCVLVKPATGDTWSACLQTLEAHGGPVWSVTFSHNSALVASASMLNVKIWDANSGECLQTLEGHSGWVRSVAFSHDSARLVSASADRTVKIWDVGNGECLTTLEGHSGSVRSVVFSHDSGRVASASTDGTIKIWDLDSSECLRVPMGHSISVYSVAFSHDSARLASASIDRTLKIWDSSSGECLQTLKGHSGWVWSVAFSHDSTRIASASSDFNIKTWDANSGECLQTLKGHSDSVWTVAFSHDSAQLASASIDRTIKIWDASSGECLQTLEGHSDSVLSVAFSHDSARLASSSLDRTIKIWDANSRNSLQKINDHSGSVWSVCFSHDSALFASASGGGMVKIWDARTGECLQTLKGHSGAVNLVAFSHDSVRLASASSDHAVKLWDVSSGECLQTLKGHGYSSKSIAFSYNSLRFASVVSGASVKIWDMANGRCLQTLDEHSRAVNFIAFSRNLVRLASASSDCTSKIWDLHSGKCVQTLFGHNSPVYSLAFSHDSTRLASASADDTVKIWNLSSGECLQTLKGHGDSVWTVTFAHDSERLASASGDRTIKIWDTLSGECLRTFDTEKILCNISFDSTGLYLHTEIGTIAIDAPTTSDITSSSTDPQNTHYQGWALTPDGVWITHNSERLMWLPSEYRPLCSAVSGNTIGIGAGSGKVWICTFGNKS